MGMPWSFPFKDPGEDLDPVGLLPRRDEGDVPGPAPVKERLDVGLVKGDTGRAAVDDGPERLAVALAKGGDAEVPAKRVHGSASSTT